MKEGTDNFKGPMPKVLRGLSSGSLGVCVCVCHSAQPQGQLPKTVSGFVGPLRLSLPGLECGGGGEGWIGWGGLCYCNPQRLSPILAHFPFPFLVVVTSLPFYASEKLHLLIILFLCV